MAYRGKVIYNPVNKQAIEFITTAKDSRGAVLEMISTWEPASLKPAPHYHPLQQEYFVVLEGEMTVSLNGKERVLHQGDSIEIPPKAVHAMWNHSGSIAKMRWQIMPALDTEYLLETGMGLAADGKISKSGTPGLLQGSLIATRYNREYRLASPPFWIQRIVFGLAKPIALLKGRRAVYQKYID
jgi:quercetin dioxygenase-like cupin family protein